MYASVYKRFVLIGTGFEMMAVMNGVGSASVLIRFFQNRN